MSEKLFEWIEFFDPFSKQIRYVNLKTGDYCLEAPNNVEIHKADNLNVWWQLYDTNTQKYYYYNKYKNQTSWNRPENCEIISFNKSQNTNNAEIKISDENKENNYEKFTKNDSNKLISVLKKTESYDLDKNLSSQNQKPLVETSLSSSSLPSVINAASSATSTPIINNKNIYLNIDNNKLTPITMYNTHLSSSPITIQQQPQHSPITIQSNTLRPNNSNDLYSIKKSLSINLNTPSPSQQRQFKNDDLNLIINPLAAATAAASVSVTTPTGSNHLATVFNHNNNLSNDNLAYYKAAFNSFDSSTSSNMNNDSISLSSSTSNSNFIDTNSLKHAGNQHYQQTQRSATIKERRKLPRTNPNYVNVDLITDDGVIKNTYVRFDKSMNSSKHSLTPTSSSSTSVGGVGGAIFVNPLNNLQHTVSNTSLYSQQQQQPPQIQGPTSLTSITSALFYSLNNSGVLNQALASSSPASIISTTTASQCNACLQYPCACSVISTNNSTPVNSPYKFLTTTSSSPAKTPINLSNTNSTIDLHNNTNSSNTTLQLDNNNEFNSSSSNTLCNYPFIDDSLTMRFRQQQQQQYQQYQQQLSNTFHDSNANTLKSPSIKIKALNNTISYPSLNRRNIDNKINQNLQSQSTVSYNNEIARPNSVFIGSTANTHHHNLPTPDNLSIKSIVSLQRTLTQPRSTNTYMCNVSTSSTTSLNTFNLKLNDKQSNTNHVLDQIDLNTHKKGGLFFSKKISTYDLMAWSKDPIQKPLIKTNDKIVKKEAPELFKLIQIYMGDRKVKNVDLRQICLDIMIKGWSMSVLRDELFFQLIKQTNFNNNKQSLKHGWELIAICLSFFPPSQKLYPFFYEHIQQYTDDSYDRDDFEISKFAKTCMKRLERIHSTGAKKGLKKPTLDEIELSKNTITCVSLFGTTLSEIMAIQNSKCPNLRLPWIQTTLSEAVLRLNGAKTEGIFRVPGDLDEVNNLKVRYDKVWCSEEFCERNLDKINLLENIEDPHLPASLLKLWYRELYEPLIPNEFYNECIKFCDNPQECIKIIEKLPDINKYVFTYLIRFLKVFAANDNVSLTKMDTNNLSMIMAPNCLRCNSEDAKTIMENTKKEMLFLKTLIIHLDTSIVQGII